MASVNTNYPLVDIGVNLTHPRMQRHLPSIIHRAVKCGVNHMIVTGVSAQLSEEAQEICEKFPAHLTFTAGVHPHHSGEWTDTTLAQLENNLNHEKCVAVGECGLDYHRNLAPKNVQLHAFEEQVKLACRVQKPLFLHERDAHEDFMTILNRYKAELPPVVVHCFTSDKDAAQTYLDMGFYIGLTAFFCKDSSKNSVKWLLENRKLPLDRLMLETDAPYMYPRIRKRILKPTITDLVTPESRRALLGCEGGGNEPCALPLIVELIAALLKEDPMHVATRTSENARIFFNIDTIVDLQDT